jgi:hypothetical protein
MDPKRWSPTKASWLETALNKPESKPKPPPNPQPAWKRGINNPTTAKSDKPGEDEGGDHVSSTKDDEKRSVLRGSSGNTLPDSKDTPGQGRPVADLSSKPKPSGPPAQDLRGQLRRPENAKSGSNTEPEFRSMLGKLRKTETKNYVAPDEFKNNILRGKAALNHTGGPQKSKRVDEFKESLISQKQAMKAGGGSIRPGALIDKKPDSTAATPAIPEAIARRQMMSRTGSVTSVTSPIEPLSKPKPQPDVRKSPERIDLPHPESGSRDSVKPAPSRKGRSKTKTR